MVVRRWQFTNQGWLRIALRNGQEVVVVAVEVRHAATDEIAFHLVDGVVQVVSLRAVTRRRGGRAGRQQGRTGDEHRERRGHDQELTGKTGVEMEAMVAVSTALLTIYDMAKAIDKGMVIGEVRLIEKRGGKSGTWKADTQ